MSVRGFGRLLARFLKTREAMNILRSYDLDEWGFGGCWILAAALKRLIGHPAELYYVGSPMGVEHVVVRIGNLYLDQDGGQTGKELKEKLRVERPFIEPFGKREQKIAAESGTYCPLDAVNELWMALAKRFGAPV
jgi:hypothetical protein